YRAVEGVELVAGADPYDSQRAAFGVKWGLDSSHLSSDYREMLQRERPGIVSICTSAKPRARILLDVVGQKTGIRALWVEKPIAITLAEADSMVDACRDAKIVLVMGASRCWDANYNRMRE